MLNVKQLEAISTEYYYYNFVFGRDKLYEHLKSKYPKMQFDSRDDVGEWLKYQEVNQLFQFQRKPKTVSSMIPIRPFHSLSLDLIDKSNKPSNNYRYILVIIDNFSRYVWCYPLKRKTPAETNKALQDFLNEIYNSWYLGNNPIKFIHFDNGSEFKNEFAATLKQENIRISNTIPYMPQSNSIVERFNGTIKRIINKLIFTHANKNYSKWSEYLEEAVKIYNDTTHSSTGKTPNEAVMIRNQVNLKEITNMISDNNIKPLVYQNSYKEGQHVRLRVSKGKLDKFDKNNFSEQKYKITNVIIPTDTELKKAAAKPTRYKIRPIDDDGNFEGKEQDPLYIKESILAIPPLLGYQKKNKIKTRATVPSLPGYVINTPQDNADALDFNLLNNLLYGSNS